MIHNRKIVFLALTALLGITGLWNWTHVIEVPQSVVFQHAESSAATPISQHAEENLSQRAIGMGDKLKPMVNGGLNWGLYSGTMQDQVQKAIADRNGPMAADLAAKLHECELNSKLQAFNSSGGGASNVDPTVQGARNERLQEEQRQMSACQTISGDQNQVRLQLLKIAVEQKVVGAADASFQAGVRTPEVLKQLVVDARVGNLNSLFQVATYSAALFGIDTETQSAIRYALKIASADASIGPRVGSLLELSEKTAPVWDTQNLSTYDYSKMSEAARKEGTEIAAQLVKQLKKPNS